MEQFNPSIKAYALDLLFCGDRSYYSDPAKSPFTSVQIINWKKDAAILKPRERGDQAAFFSPCGVSAYPTMVEVLSNYASI